jgi:predicted dehydrogenase
MGGSHLRSYDPLRDRLHIVATADTIVERAEEAAQAVGAQVAVADYHDLLDGVDAVLIALPHHLHYEVGLECLRAGKHVLMEKPLALDEAQCLDLIHTARACGRVLMVAYCMRYHPLSVRMKELIEHRAYGDVFQISIWTEQHTQYPPGHWAMSAATLGGGQLFSHGCHYIDLLLWFLGRPVRGVHLGTHYGTPWMEREGTSNVVLEFEGGALGYHMGTWGARGTRHGYNFQAHCTEGMIEADITGGKLYVHRGRDTELLCELGQQPNLKHTYLEMAHFCDCVEHGLPPLTDGPGSLQGLRVIWRLYEAEDGGAMADLRGLGLDEEWER